MTAVILINWNGAADTIDCLESLNRAEGEFFVVVADNGSTDDSLERICEYASGLSIKVHVIDLERNWGFAAGNNRAVSYASAFNPDSYMLLNNDTVVEPDFLKRIQSYRREHPGTRILGPVICYWYDRDKIWSCGGQLVFGSRKAFFRDRSRRELNLTRPVRVSFMSGCALFADASLLDSHGKLLTERFFFGEEDYEFAHRMKVQGEEMVILPDSVIYHKVGSSAKKMSARAKLGRDYVYYLSRFIVVRSYYNRLSSALVRLLSRRRCRRYFMEDGLDGKSAARLVRRLMYDARHKDGVDYDYFRELVIEGTFFDRF